MGKDVKVGERGVSGKGPLGGPGGCGSMPGHWLPLLAPAPARYLQANSMLRDLGGAGRTDSSSSHGSTDSINSFTDKATAADERLEQSSQLCPGPAQPCPSLAPDLPQISPRSTPALPQPSPSFCHRPPQRYPALPDPCPSPALALPNPAPAFPTLGPASPSQAALQVAGGGSGGAELNKRSGYSDCVVTTLWITCRGLHRG
ncbi:uncharacterized protein LOC134775887 [Penaeus indicus]|uniref:uncharacterized protein LOC134775887 n=1 Tax=Penaeus indicus TaxID=29960 RepID=UPI00300D3D93